MQEDDNVKDPSRKIHIIFESSSYYPLVILKRTVWP